MDNNQFKWWMNPFLPNIFYGRLYKKLLEAIVERKECINFAVLGVPQSGKTHFICIVRDEPYIKDKHTALHGYDLEEKCVMLNGKKLVYKKGKDINGAQVNQYPELIKKADVIYFFFRADYYLKNQKLRTIGKGKDFLPQDLQRYETYQDLVHSDFGLVVGDKNAKNKPVKIVASFRKNIGNDMSENRIKLTIMDSMNQGIKNIDWSKIDIFLADIDDEHREWVKEHANELIFIKK